MGIEGGKRGPEVGPESDEVGEQLPILPCGATEIAGGIERGSSIGDICVYNKREPVDLGGDKRLWGVNCLRCSGAACVITTGPENTATSVSLDGESMGYMCETPRPREACP